ncbi:MAG: efflux RND transporter periplasmic adaptor subunit [Candidatus Moraniibacteriota bacterium]|nr:MAG: efflux RND transporter periplasmic adaptor subunit [Candidatus Moranbacteria bacterium]
MKLATKLWGGVIVIAIIGLAWYWSTRPNPADSIVTETVSRTDVSETVSVSGELVPTEYADLSFRAIGRVEEVYVKEGESVKAGDPLAVLDRSVQMSQLAAAEVALRIAEEAEKLALRNKNDLDPEERRAKKLASEAAREDVRTLRAEMEKSVIRAPFDGRITRVDLRSGETTSIGVAVFRIARSAGLVVESRVPESDIVKLSVGMEASVTFDALDSSDLFRAKVVAIDESATIVQDVVSYVVTFEVAAIDERLRDGMSADIDVVTAKREGVLAVPFRALTVRGEKTFATLSRTDGTTEEVQVKTGLEGDDGMVEIVSSLKEGDVVVIGTVSE